MKTTIHHTSPSLLAAFLLAAGPMIGSGDAHAQTSVNNACVKAKGNFAHVSRPNFDLNASVILTNECTAAFKIMLVRRVSAVDNKGVSWAQYNVTNVAGIGATGYCSYESGLRDCLENLGDTVATEMQPGTSIIVVFNKMPRVDANAKQFGDVVALAISAQFRELQGKAVWRGISVGAPGIKLTVND